MKYGEGVTQKQLESAVAHTQAELGELGLWSEKSRLHACQVFWCRLPQLNLRDALGFFVSETSRYFPAFLGYAPGHIYIPRWVLWPYQGTHSLRDVIRHEYGHAVAHYYPAMIQRSKRFSETFNGRYSEGHTFEFDARDCVSPYAMTSPMEDFAETFMLYVKHKGKKPAKFKSEAISLKWQFVTDLVARIAAGAAKW